MTPLFRYQLQHHKFSFTFVTIFFLILAIVLQNNLFITPERLFTYAVIVSIIPNFYTFMTQNDFRRMILTMPIDVKEIVKAVYLMFLIFTAYVVIFGTAVGLVLKLIFNNDNQLLIGFFLTLPSVWAVLGVRHYVLLRNKIEGVFGLELLVLLGMGLFFAAMLAMVFILPEQFFSIYVAIYILICLAITYYTYRLSLKNADLLYVIVRREIADDFHESIHHE